MWESSLVLSGTSCETFWPRGQYIQSQTFENIGVYENNIWMECNSSWYEWPSQESNMWISCKKGFYLSFSSTGGFLGTWDAIISDYIILELFVKSSYEETNGNGMYDNPFGNIVKALNYAEEQTSMYTNSTVNICKENKYNNI